MVSRIAIPRVHRPVISLDRRHFTDAGHRVANWRPPRGEELHLLLYRAAWAPFWISSDVPAPRFRTADEPVPPGGPAGDHVVSLLGQLQRRIWLQRAMTVIFRAIWMPLLIGCGWNALELAGGPPIRSQPLVVLGLILLIPAGLFAYLIRPSRRQVARMLDSSFGLQDRMLTAVDNVGKSVPAEGERAQVMYLQMADAANVVTELRTHPAFRVRPPVRELVLAIACALLLSALYFMRGVGGDIPAAATDAVPSYIPAAERLAQQPEPQQQASAATADAPTQEDVQAKAERSNQAQQDLKALSDALSDQAVTREAADAIDRGDYAAAADLIRNVAENADQLSPAAREGLADDLDAAADQMSPGSEDLANAAHEAADGLREGGEAAKQGMSDLGDAVDRTASEIVSQQDLASEMQQAQAADAERAANGESGQASESGNGEQSNGESSGDQSSQEGDQAGSDQPSEGADAQPGSGDGEQSGAGEGSQNSGGDNQSVSNDPKAAGQEAGAAQTEGDGQNGSADQPGNGTQPGSAGSESDQSSDNQAESDGEGGQAGSGAGSGDSEANSESGQGADGTDSANTDPNVADPNETDAQSGGDGTTTDPNDPRSAITLSRSPDSSGIQSGSNSGSASAGSGGGAAVSSGTSVQGDVGEAGPDSNRVPSEYRSIVEDYFSDDDQ